MTDKKTRIVSNLLSLVLGAGIGAGVYAIKEQITHGGNERIEMEAPSEDVGGGVIFNKPEGNGMQLTTTKLLSSEYDEYGVSHAQLHRSCRRRINIVQKRIGTLERALNIHFGIQNLCHHAF